MTSARADVDDNVAEMTSTGDPAARGACERVVNLRRNFCRRVKARGMPDDADSSPVM